MPGKVRGWRRPASQETGHPLVVTRERAGRGVPAGRALFSAGAAGLRVTDDAVAGERRVFADPLAQPVREPGELRPLKRGWCPDILHPMPTGDGLLVRLYPPLGGLTSGQLRAIAIAARSCGNGLVDVSNRANLQIRGLSQRSHPGVVDQLAAVGLVGPTPRRTIVSPLAGLDPTDHVDAAALAMRVEAALQAAEGLSGKLAVAVDGGGLFPLVELNAKIYLVALSSTAIALGVAAAEGLRWWGATAPAAVPSALTAMLTGINAEVRAGKPSAPPDTAAELRAEIADAAELAPAPQPSSRPPAPRAGVVQTAGVGVAAVLALPYGRCDADQLLRIAGWAERFGDGEVRLSPWRGIVLSRVRRHDIGTLIALASGAGLITDPGDPRLAIFACPGQPDCASASVMTRSDAARLAGAAQPLLRTGAQIHVSGCAKGCAHRSRAALTLIGDNGAYRVIVEGTPADTAVASLPIDEIAHRLEPVETRAGLAARFSAAALT